MVVLFAVVAAEGDVGIIGVQAVTLDMVDMDHKVMGVKVVSSSFVFV